MNILTLIIQMSFIPVSVWIKYFFANMTISISINTIRKLIDKNYLNL